MHKGRMESQLKEIRLFLLVFVLASLTTIIFARTGMFSLLPVQPANLTIFVKTDKETYEIGDPLNVTIFVNSSNKPYFGSGNFSIARQNEKYKQAELTVENGVANYLVFLDLPKPGKYNVTFSVANKMNYTEINVLKKDSIILRTDKSIYAKNETIKIFGYLDFKNKTANSIDIGVLSPANAPIANVTIEVINNTFEFNLLPDFISDYGNYTIIAKTLNITNSTTFEVQKQKTLDIKASINKREFFYGDEIDIIANITEDGKPYNGNAIISLIYPDSTIASVNSLVANGLLSYKLIADFDENGTYKISIKVENAEETIEFNYTNNKTQEKISVIILETNKHVLYPNETLVVNGCVVLNGELYNGNAKISLSNNITELKALTTIVSNCSFNASFNLTDYQPGKYAIEVSSANITNETEFYIVSSTINETQEIINKTIEQKTRIISDYKELDTPIGKFNMTTSKGKIDLFQLKGDESELAISSLTPGEKVNVSIKLPFQIPKDIEFYVWKNISGKVVLINYTLNENRDVISFELQDGKLDEDGKIDGKIVDPLIIPVSKIKNAPRIIASSESKVSMKYENQIAEVEVLNGTLDYFKPSVIPEQLIGKNIVLPAGMFKFRISNVSGKAVLRIHLTKAIDFTTKYIKFNPKTLETKSIPFKQIDPLTIEVVFEDNGPFDENPAIGIIEDDSGLASSWWNTSFKYRLPINITSSSTENISSFPAHLIVNTASLITSGKMNSDCSDIRFTFWNLTSQQEEKIPYLFVGPCNTTRSLVWVRLPILYDSNFNTTVIMYYGNSSASSESDASSVFPGIRAYWPFEEGSGSEVNDYSGNDYDGILADVAGGDLPLWDSSSSCKIGYCIESDDTGDAVNVSYLAVNGLNNVTFEAWIKTTDDRWGLISGAGSGSDNEYLIYLETTPSLRLYIKGSYDGANPGSITDGNWHHLAIVRNSDGTSAIYIDGSLLTTLSGLTTGTLSISPNGLWLMQEQDSVGGGWDTAQAYIGTLDDVKIFSKSLTLDEIKKETTNYTTSLGSEEYVARLNATITYPNEGFIATRYQQFNLNATIYCNRGNCSDVYAYAQYVAPGGISSKITEDTYSDFSTYNETQNVTITDEKIKLQPESGESWFNESWQYRKKINITYNGVGNLTDYTIKTTIDTASLITSGKMNSDCSDIVFTYYNSTSKNEEEIPYWIESGCNSTNTKTWIKVPFIRNSTYGNETIYMYYGNPSANVSYKPEDVFEYFVNFTKLGVQSAYGSSQDQTPSQYEVVNDTTLHMWGNNWKGVYYGPISIAGDGKNMLELEINGTNTAEIYGVGFDTDLDNVADAQSTTYQFAGSQSWGITPDQSYTNFGNWQTVYAVLDDFSGQYLYFIFANDDDNDANGDVWYKNVRIRRYATSEPTISIENEEQLNIKPTGYYVSNVIDFGKDDIQLNRIYWFDETNENTTIKVYTRSSTDGNTWSPWYLETNNSDVDAPDNRYLQYKVELSTTNTEQTPYFDGIVIEYTYTEPQFTNMKSSGTDFTTSTNPQTFNGLDESNSPWNVSWQITPREKGNYTIRVFVNSSINEIKPVQSQWINISVYEQTYITEMKIEPNIQYKGASVTISARLLDALSNPIPNQNITFKDETSGQIIGSSLTDSNGYTSVVYNIPESTTIGYHTIKANYSGNASLFYFDSWTTGQLKVSSSPKFWDIILSDKEIGNDEHERIQVNVTDEVGLDKVILYLAYPNGTESEFLMSYNSSTGYYEYTTEKLWQAGDYNFYIFANNTDGISNTSWQDSFSVKIIGRLDIAAEKNKYKNFEIVHLSNIDDSWDFSNYTYRSVVYVYSNQTESEVPVNIQVNTSQLISEGKMNPNCSDIRFVQTMTIEELPIKISNPYGVTKYNITFPIVITDKDALSKIKGNDVRIFTYSTNEPYANEPDVPFWVDYVTTSEAKIWVKLDTLPTTGKTIYLYYGNSSAEDKSNYTAVFTDIVGEAGIVYHNDTWVNFDYVNSTTDLKFVFASLNSYYGSDEAFARITQVNNSGFHVVIQESAGLDQSHAYENIGWLALRNGTWIVDGKAWQIGNASMTDGYYNINFYEVFSTNPVILSQIQTFNEADPAKTRMDNPTTSGVSIKIEETSDTTHTTESVAWFAAEPGEYDIGTHVYLGKEYINQPSDVSSTGGWTTFSAGSQPTTPAVIAKIMTENGGDNSHERIRNVGTSSFEYAIEEEYGYDGTHTYEWNGYIVIEPNKPVYGAKKLDTWPSSTEETNNKRIIKTVTVELPFWIEYGCNSGNTSIWFKASYLSEGKNTIYMYYGNPSDTFIENTEENETSVFTYSSKYGSYVVLGIDGSSLDVSSYSDSNEITLGQTSTTLNEQQTYTFTSTDVSRGNLLYSKGPVSSGTQSSGDGAPLTPFTFAGKEFVIAIARYDPIYFDFYALDDATIQVWVSNPAGSAWSLQDEFTLNEGNSVSKSYSGTDTDATAELSYKINSTGEILVFFRGNNDDYMPLVPAHTELYLEPSNYIELAALEDGTTVTIYYSNGNTPTVLNLNAGDVYTSSSLGNDGSAPAIRIVSNKQVFAYQLADSDGTEATPALPRRLMDSVFVFPQDAEYFVAVTPANEVTKCTLYNTAGSIAAGPWVASGTTNEPGKIGYGTGQDGTTYINAGYKLVCNNTVFVYYEQAADDAETLIYGPKAHAKYLDVSAEIAYEEDKWVNLENNGNETLKGYLWAIVQRYDDPTGDWVNIPPAIINDLATNNLRILQPGESINLTQLWESQGAWNTSDNPAGKYRILFKFTDLEGNAIYDYELRALTDYFVFEIVPANISLENITYENKFNYNLNEYETGDTIKWINATIKAFNDSAINTVVHLTLIDSSGSYAGVGPNDETYDCGLLYENTYCTARFDNSSYGYPIPNNLAITSENYTLKVNVTLDNGDDYINTTNNITIHNLQSTFSSTQPDRLYQNGDPVYYNFTLKNLWSKNLTNVKVKINCPQLNGLTCECLDNPGSDVCDIGNLTSQGERTVSFKISATEDTPTGDYVVNATVNYTNPANNDKYWPEQKPQTLEIRTIGIMEITPYEYPTSITRGESFDFKAYANNTGSQTASEAWLAYSSYPSGWSIASGQQNVSQTNVAPGEHFWNNVTFSTSISSSLGAQTIKLESASNLGQQDFKYVTIYVYGNTSLKLWVNDTNVSKGEAVRIYAKLSWDNSTAIPNEQISFYDETENSLIDTATTNSDGTAYVDYTISDSLSLGTHVINASFSGDTNIYANPSNNKTQINIGLKPFINSIEFVPSQTIGYGTNITIRANVTDDQTVNEVNITILTPKGEEYTKTMRHVTGDIYEVWFNDTWVNGTYNITIIAKDSYDSINESESHFVVEIKAGISVKTGKDVYYPAENVNLASAPLYPFKYKREISINNTLNQNLTEYQINLIINTSDLIANGKMKNDCSDIRFSWFNETSQKEEKIPYYLDYGCNSNETSIWVKIPKIYANNITKIYMYYGSDFATSESNASEVFSYSSEQTTFYVVSYVASSSSLNVVAFEDNTHVTFNGASTTLNKAQTHTFSASNSMTTGLAHDKPVFSAFSADTTDAIHPISWAGKRFVYYVNRGTNEWYFYAPFGDAQINISNSTHLKTTINLANGSAHRAQVDITDGDVAIIESNISILAQHAAASDSEDSRLLYPASTKLYGVPSNYIEVAAIEDGTHVDVYCSDGTTYSWDLNRGQGQSISGLGDEGTAPACVVIANKPVGANSLADSDGTETTTFLPLKELDKVYFLSQGTQYIAIAAPFTTTCKLYDSSGTLQDTKSANPNGNAPGKIYFGSTTDGTNIAAGSYVVCDQPVFAYYEYSGTSGGDETNLFGVKGNRKYAGIDLNYTIGNETVSGSAVFNYNAPFKGFVVATVEKNVSGTWQHITTLLNDTATNTVRDFSSEINDLSSIVPSWNPQGDTGEFRITVKVVNPDYGLLNTTNGGQLVDSYVFNVTQVPLKLNISEIRVYEAPNNEHGGGTLIDSGINKTFNLEVGKTYRFEIDVDVLSDSQTWQINESNVTFSNLNQSWIIDTLNNVWYLNQTDSVERSGGTFSSGILEWDTSNNDGYAASGTKVTFYFIVNLTDAIEEDRSVQFKITAPGTIFKDFDTLNIYQPDIWPPKLYNEIYGLNATEILRGEPVLAYARWDEEISNAKIEYNSTTNLLMNNTITLPSPNPQNWTNYTIETSSLWLLGKHSIKIYASDVADNWNVTPTMLLNVYGLAYVDSISVNDTTPQLNDYVKIECLVKDDTNSNGISNYNVMFWFDDTNFANATTNSSGYASVEYQLTQPGSHMIKCNITNDTQNYYKIDSRNYKEQSIFVSETEAPQWHEVSYPSIAHKGDTIKLSTRWTDNFELGYATLATNASGSYQNVSSLSLTGTDDWANFSYQVPTTMQPGYLAWKQYANDTSDNENVTNEYTIEIWGWSKISYAEVIPSSIEQGGYTTMYCRVVDANDTNPIEGYTVSFYLGDTYLGSNTTNATGYAMYNFSSSNAGVFTVKCNISDYVAKKYNASEANEGSDTLTVSATQDVTPPKIVDNNYGINDTALYRYDSLLVYGQWDEEIDKVWVEYNVSSLTMQTVYFDDSGTPGNWTNYTITTGDSWKPGIHVVKLYANDTSGNINDTLDYLTFELWGRSGVYWIEPATDQYRGTLTIKCQVKDIDTDTGIESYVVEFYNSTNYLGSNTTDANGYAIFVEDTTGYTPGEQTFYCKIQDDNSKYYDAITTQASKTINILGKLNVTILNPKNDEILERGNSYSLQSITKDEFGNVVAPSTANWYANENSIGTSENISWNVPLNQQLGSTTLKINVTKSYYDSDEDSVNIYIYGHAQAKWISPNDGSYPAGKILQLVCFVNDSDTNSGIENYPVRFYYNGTLIGSSTTNATGYATINWDTSSLNGVYVVSCNITDDSTLYYNATVDSDYTTVEIYVDTTPPSVTIVNPENASYSITDINLNYSATDAHLDSCWYSLDNGANVSLPNCQNTTLTSLSDGSHVVRVYANDTSDNEGYDEVYFTVDTQAPIITIISPENETYDTSWVWGNVSVNENADWCGYSVDDSTNTTMSSASPTYWYANISSLADGTHKITFYCNDTAGNENSSAVYTTIDTTLPQVQLLEPEGNKVLNTDYLTFICNASDNIKIANVSLLTNETGSLVIVETNTSGINGNYTFSRSVQDGVYEWTCQVCDYVHCVLASENRTVIADTQAPNVSLISPTNTTYNIDNVWLNYTVNDLTLDSCWYELDGVNHSLASCQNVSLTSLSNSAHHVIIFANDSLGRESYDEVYFTVDTIAPTINVQSPVNNTEYGVNTIPLEYTVSDNLGIDSCWYSLDNGANTTLSNCENTTLTGLDNGIHNVTVYVKDVAENENYSYINFSVNSVAPVVNIINPEEGKFYNVNDINLNYTVEDSDLDSCWYSLDNGANVSLPNCQNTTLYDLTEGYHTIRVYANDSQAHESYDQVSFYVDTVAPMITVILPTNTSYTISTIWLNYTIEDSYLDSCWYELDGVNHSLANCENVSLSLTDGTHAIRVYANDSASNENASETVYFTVDTQAPIITIVSPENETYTTSTINLNYTVSDNLGIDSCWYSLDNQENVTLASCTNTTINGIPDGSHAVTVYANDTTGNENSSTEWFTIDTTGPQITFVQPTPNDNQALDYNWTYTNITTDEPASIAILEWNYNNGTIINYTMNSNTATNWWYNITNLQDGTYYYKVYANDSFDNWASTAKRSVRISIGAPVIDILLPENVTYTQTNYLKLNVTSNKEIDTWWYSINGKENITFAPNSSIAASIGTNEIKVYGNDSTGNVGWGSVVFTVETNKWEDYFDHYSGIEEYENASIENGKAKITFCYDFFEPECWPYRIPITLTNSQASDLMDFQTNISVDTSSLISSGKMNSDCSDIRFTYVNASGEYEIPYWIESGCNSTNTIIWVKVPKIAASSTATIYMYYGNTLATSESNVSKVFSNYSSTLSCQGSTAGGSCSVVFNAPAGEVFAPYGNLYFKMAGDFGYGGAYSSTDSICDENYERANVSVEGNGKGCYSTGIDGCTLYAPSGFPVSVSNDIKDKSSVTVVGDSTSKVNGDPNSCGFYYKFEFTLDAYTRKDVTLPSFSLGSEQTNIRNATIMSIEIKPRKVARWDKFFAIHSTPANTEITYEILDSNNNMLLTCDSTTASTGCDLSSITTNSIKLFAKLGTTTSETPELDYWNVSWTPNSSITITLIDENSQVNTNALLKLYKNNSLIAQGYGSVTTESEIYENHTLVSDTSLASGHLVTELHNLNITKSSLTIKQQIVEDYTSSLPSQIGNVTPVFALNDTELTFEKATLYIPKNGLKIDYILHCTDWDFSTATCNNWVLNDTTDYEGFGENTTHFWFNVTSFEAYTGGQLAYDLKVNEITFNTSQPVENKPVLVTANISNEASSDIDSATIKLEVYYWNGSVWLLDGTQEKDISVAGNSYNLTNFTWYAKIGTYNFTVIADPNDLIDESDETNNVNSTMLNVSAWSIYYGVVNGWITIADNSGHNFTVWIPQTKEGNLYFADYDSNFDFDNLMPLNGTNDLAEADQALNMSSFNDSIEHLFDKNDDGAADATDCFNIGTRLVCNVPIINSTDSNNGNFITGILWDSGDGGTEYDGTQDLVFITKINPNKQGSYGTYDYEIRVPAYLRQLKPSTNLVKILFEIR